mgnify:CR=1 FL=1
MLLIFRKEQLDTDFRNRTAVPVYFESASVGINGRKIMESRIVLGAGCIGFLPFFVQLFIHFPIT